MCETRDVSEDSAGALVFGLLAIEPVGVDATTAFELDEATSLQ